MTTTSQSWLAGVSGLIAGATLFAVDTAVEWGSASGRAG